ncbi:MAG: hypothetical protein IPI01_15380 [Ignavibacteriae bacterium]|nr:hypothetical protein [Ignavibacteriota bacterium]
MAETFNRQGNEDQDEVQHEKELLVSNLLVAYSTQTLRTVEAKKTLNGKSYTAGVTPSQDWVKATLKN